MEFSLGFYELILVLQRPLSDFVVHQTLPFQSVSVDTFNSKNDVYVAIAQPSMENCMVLEWDHIEMNFRSYDNITGVLGKDASAVRIKGRLGALA